MMKRPVFALLCLLAMTGCHHSAETPEARAQRLGEQLRCPVCRGVPIVSSPSTLAQQMMEVVRQEIAAGKSDAEILSYFEQRYGQWALLEPKAEGLNWVVWIFPALFLTGGAAFILYRIRRQINNKGGS